MLRVVLCPREGDCLAQFQGPRATPVGQAQTHTWALWVGGSRAHTLCPLASWARAPDLALLAEQPCSPRGRTWPPGGWGPACTTSLRTTPVRPSSPPGRRSQVREVRQLLATQQSWGRERALSQGGLGTSHRVPAQHETSETPVGPPARPSLEREGQMPLFTPWPDSTPRGWACDQPRPSGTGGQCAAHGAFGKQEVRPGGSCWVSSWGLSPGRKAGHSGLTVPASQTGLGVQGGVYRDRCAGQVCRGCVCRGAPALPPPAPQTAPPSRLSIWLWMGRAWASVQSGLFNYPPIIIDSSFENKSHIFSGSPKFFHLNQSMGGGRHPAGLPVEPGGAPQKSPSSACPPPGGCGLWGRRWLSSLFHRPRPTPSRRAEGRDTKGACAGRAQGGGPSVQGAPPRHLGAARVASVSCTCDPRQRPGPWSRHASGGQGQWFSAGPGVGTGEAQCPPGRGVGGAVSPQRPGLLSLRA